MATAAALTYVQKLYIAYYQRPADYAGLQYWSDRVDKEGVSNVVNAFATSPESVSLYGSLALQAQIDAVYKAAFGRAAETVGLQYYINEINAGRLTIGKMALAILDGATGTDATTLASKLAVAGAYTDALSDNAGILKYVGESSATTARIFLAAVLPSTQAAQTAAIPANIATLSAATLFTLTPGLDLQTADSFFASQTIFNVDGKGPTLNTGDKLFGTAGKTTNTLTITDLSPGTTNGNIPAGVTLTNIQNIILNSSGNTAAGTGFSTVGYADVRSLKGTTNGGAADVFTAANGVNGTVVNATHNGFAGALTVVGGTDVTATSVGGDILVGSPGLARVPLAAEVTTGKIVVNQNNSATGKVNVFGGTTVNVTTSSSSNSGVIEIGNTAANTGNNTAGKVANASGNITVNSAGTGAITVFGGVDVSINDTALKGAGAITVGDAGRVDLTNLPTGNVTINEVAQIAYNGLAGSTNNNTAAGAIGVSGGKNVTITSNAANAVNIGNLGAAKENTLNPSGVIKVTNTGIVNNGAATGAVLITGGTDVTVSTTGANVTIGRAANAGVADQVSNPTGNVTVTETLNGNGFARAVVIDGGSNVTVNAKGQNVTIGQSVASAPTGAVLVNQSDMLTGTGAYLATTNAGDVIVDGGTTVTVNTTGGAVTVGEVISGVNTVPSGAVAITRTFSGPGADTTTVRGGSTVAITTTKTSGAITVGAASDALNAAGTALKDANLAPTGDVTIADVTSVGGINYHGVGVVNVNTNGAATVSIRGGNTAAIKDIQATLATGGGNSGKAVGVSKLANVSLTGLQGADGVAITSDALTALSVLNTEGGANTITITNNTAAHALTITQGANNKNVWDNGVATTSNVTVVDSKAGTLTITDNGTASSATLQVDAAAATAVTVNNAAAATLKLGNVSTAIATVTLKGAGATTFDTADVFGTGNLGKAMTVDASAATGNVTSLMQATTTAATAQKYMGGSGVDTLTVNSNASGWGNLVAIDGGAGTSDVLVANYAAAGTDVALGSATAVKGFEILRLGALANSAAGSYDASGFNTDVQLGAVAGNITLTNLGGVFSVTANTTDKTVSLAGSNTTATNNALTINVGTGGTALASPGSAILAAGGGLGTGIITANAFEAITINAKGGYVSTANATSLNTVSLTDTGTAGAATLVVGGDRGLALTSTAGFTSINASTHTGTTTNNGTLVNSATSVDVTAAKVSNAGTTFTGGTSVLKAAGSNDTTNFKALVTLTGTATNNWQNGDTATVTINGATYTYTSIGNNSAATVAGLLAAAITNDATTNNALGNVVKGGTGSPAVTAVSSGGSIVLTKAAAFEVGTAKSAANATIADVIVGGQQQIVLESATAVGGAGAGNITVTFNGGAGAITIAVANNDTTAQIATKIAAGITAAASTDKPGIASAVVVDSTKVLITVQAGEISQLAVAGTAAFVGAGVATTDSTNFATVDNLFTSGAGGGEYKAGLGGAWNAISHKFSSGSETVNLTASTAKVDKLILKEGATLTDNGSKGGVTKFTVNSQSASDTITFRNTADNADLAKTILANSGTNGVNNVTGANTMATVLDSSGALFTKLANLTYSISNGVITFGATGGNNLSQFTTNELISAASILVSSATTGGANKVVAFSSNGRSYVVSSDNGNTLQAGTNNNSVIVELKDVASVKGFGSTFGEAIVVATNVTNITGSADITTLATSSTLDYTGFSKATLTAAGTAAANTNTTKFTNLAASAEVVLNATGNTHIGLLETTQMGASGSNSLTVTMQTNATTVNKLTVTGDALVKFAANGAAHIVQELADASNTVNTIQVTGNNAFTLLKETGTALNTIDSTLAGGKFTFGNGTFTNTTTFTVTAADAHNNVTFNLAAGQAADLFTSGSGLKFIQATDSTAGTEAASVGTGLIQAVASGGSNTFTLGNGANQLVANGAGDVITVGTGSNTIVATGAGDVFNIASGAGTTQVTVGTGATVNIGTVNVANGGAETVVVTGAVTGGTTAAYANTTINFAAGSTVTGHQVSFGTTADAFTLLGASVAASQINVATAASLTDALNMAANFTLLTTAQGTDPAASTLAANTGRVDWFQYGGDTYVVAMVNSTGAALQQTALDANDIVVKITGLVDLTGSGFAGEVLTF
ncbi:DUF4214 domain-containing protein [Iodobacter sp. LRB]|uniref:DUF4214 domain-containing protein n=1 Tax=unclassified Iodobacter TaxID=235634 RepID=UPI000C0F87B9|nr:DUF4214 domain-containing protein [Iodobacter sp. BJB302]PHU99694.1 hypothetical protein CSQ88_21160 [Iodobacter sp. BJB302]